MEAIGNVEVKLLEIIAAGAFSTAAIFFTVLTVLLGAILTTRPASEKRPLYFGAMVTYGFVIVSIILTGLALTALRFQVWGFYIATVIATGLTIAGILIVATIVFLKAKAASV